MRYKKVLLISPKFHTGRNRLALLPLAGLGYIAEALEKTGVEVKVLDMNLGYCLRDIKSYLRKYNSDIIGFTAMTLGYKYLYEMINDVRLMQPEAKIVIGGAHISALREKVLEECPAIDFGIILEGDISMVRLCRGDNLDKIQGLIYRENSKVITNRFGNFIRDLDEIPFPRYRSFELDKYPTRQLGIVTSRGCPYDCIYCSVIATIGKQFRARSAQSIVDEIEYWYNRGFRDIFILDDNFTLIRKRVEEICGLLAKKNFKGLHFKCPNGIRADRVDRTLLKAMKEVGFDFISFGVEAASDNVLRCIKKGESIASIEKSIQDACEIGFDVDLFFLIGSPGETREDVNLSFALAQRYPLRRAIFYNLIPLPATELLAWLTAKGYLLHPIEYILNNASYYLDQPFFFTPELSVTQRKEALKTGRMITLNIRRKYIERKLKGPLPLKRLFSYLYTLPVIDDTLVNSRLVVKTKEKIKQIFIR